MHPQLCLPCTPHTSAPPCPIPSLSLSFTNSLRPMMFRLHSNWPLFRLLTSLPCREKGSRQPSPKDNSRCTPGTGHRRVHAPGLAALARLDRPWQGRRQGGSPPGQPLQLPASASHLGCPLAEAPHHICHCQCLACARAHAFQSLAVTKGVSDKGALVSFPWGEHMQVFT